MQMLSFKSGFMVATLRPVFLLHLTSRVCRGRGDPNSWIWRSV